MKIKRLEEIKEVYLGLSQREIEKVQFPPEQEKANDEYVASENDDDLYFTSGNYDSDGSIDDDYSIRRHRDFDGIEAKSNNTNTEHPNHKIVDTYSNDGDMQREQRKKGNNK